MHQDQQLNVHGATTYTRQRTLLNRSFFRRFPGEKRAHPAQPAAAGESVGSFILRPPIRQREDGRALDLRVRRVGRSTRGRSSGVASMESAASSRIKFPMPGSILAASFSTRVVSRTRNRTRMPNYVLYIYTRERERDGGMINEERRSSAGGAAS